MKVAVACTGEQTISSHFGRSDRFVVFQLGEGKVLSSETIANDGTCGSHEGGCGDDHKEHHSHEGIISLLRGCDAVICHGMGPRIARELAMEGIRPVVVSQICTPEQAALLYCMGRLPMGRPGSCCRGEKAHGS